MKINKLKFKPLLGLSSCHLQMIVSSYLPKGLPAPSERCLVELEDSNYLSCEISTPPCWQQTGLTVILVHGMGGSHASNYMIRLSRKLYAKGIKVVRVNLRGCGSGKGLSKLPYHAGTSFDVLKVLQFLKERSPFSEIILVGFSLGGNIALKLAGELGALAKGLVNTFIAVCAPLDLAHTVDRIQEKRNQLYHSYYLKHISRQVRAFSSQRVQTLYEFDDVITAPLWGYEGANAYYQDCSSMRFLPNIEQTTHLLFAEDDPFISFDELKGLSLADSVHLWTTEHGGHMGFLGRTPNSYSPYWMDHVLLHWIDEPTS
ncbi:MAG: alpha/beta fold hydrolase [Chlamydiota bacterium]